MSNTTCIDTNWSNIPAVQNTQSEGYSLLPKTEYVRVSYDVHSLAVHGKLGVSYAKFPVLTLLLNGTAVLSMTGLLAYVFFGLHTIHPYVLFWSAVASGGLASVIWTAAGEFDGTSE